MTCVTTMKWYDQGQGSSRLLTYVCYHNSREHNIYWHVFGQLFEENKPASECLIASCFASCHILTCYGILSSFEGTARSFFADLCQRELSSRGIHPETLHVIDISPSPAINRLMNNPLDVAYCRCVDCHVCHIFLYPLFFSSWLSILIIKCEVLFLCVFVW